MDIERAKQFAEMAKAITDTGAREANEVAYVARVLAQVTLPHSKTDAMKFERSNGLVRIAMLGDPDLGLPFGTYPRLILTWVATEAVRTKSPVLELGDSLSSFMAELGLVPTGGRWGSITRLRDQVNRLFKTTITWSVEDKARGAKLMRAVVPFSEGHFWWDPKRPDQVQFWQSIVKLSHEFFHAIVDRPVPIDMRALKLLAHQGRSPLSLDIYTWLTYRMSYLEEPVTVPWAGLQLQFGAGYARVRDFRAKFLERLKEVQQIYPAARVRPVAKGLLLEPSPTHVPRIVKPKIKLLVPA